MYEENDNLEVSGEEIVSSRRKSRNGRLER